MNEVSKSLDTLQDIKQIMERSSRFISLSGLSGIAAGTCALIGAAVAGNIIHEPPGDAANFYITYPLRDTPIALRDIARNGLFQVAIFTFIAAFILAFIFTYVRSRNSGTTIWSSTSRRVMFNVGVPMVVGGIFVLKLIQLGDYGMIAPGCLLFYGLALVNAGKYTLGEIKYLGYAEIFTGLLNLFAIGYGLYFWAFGFGVLHIVYGALMWWRYERN